MKFHISKIRAKQYASVKLSVLFLFTLLIYSRYVVAASHPVVIAGQQNSIDVSKDLVPLHIADNNMAPNSPDIDAGPLLEAAVKYASDKGIGHLIIPAGDYYFSSARHNAFVYLNTVHNVTISGEGSNFIFTSRKSNGIIVYNSNNIGIENINLDYTPDLPFTTAIVSSVDVAGRTINIASIDGRPITDFDNTGKNSLRVFVLRRGRGGNYSSVQVERFAVVKGPLSNSAIHINASPYGGENMLDKDLSQIRQGDILSISERSYSSVNALSFFSYPPMISSGNYAKNLTIYSSPSIGITCLWQNNIIISDVKVIPKPGRVQYISSNADGINMTNTGADSKIINNTIVASGDDGISVSSNLYGTVTAVNSPSSFTFALRYLLSANQSVAIADPDALNEYGSGRVTDQQLLPDRYNGLKQFNVTLDNSLRNVKVGAYIFIPKENRSLGLLVQNNTIQKVNARGIYIAGATGVQILSNTIEQSNSCGICVQELSEPNNGYKSPGNSDISIVGNYIHKAFAFGYTSAKGAIEASASGGNSDTESVNDGLIIHDNEVSIAPDHDNLHHVGIFLEHTKRQQIGVNLLEVEKDDGSKSTLSSDRSIVIGNR